MQESSVEDSHGFFQFADSIFSEDSKYDKELLEDEPLPQYTPKVIYPHWYIDSDDQSLLNLKYKADHLYCTKSFLECHIECMKAINKLECEGKKRGSLFREFAELSIMSLVKQNRIEDAVELLEKLLGSYDIEDPGLFKLRSKVYASSKKQNHYNQAVFWAQRLLEIRPGDPYATKIISKSHQNRRVLVKFAQTKEEFRRGEFDALCELFGIRYTPITEYTDASPFWIIEIQEGGIQSLLDRSVLVKDLIELWARGDTVDALVETVLNDCRQLIAPFRKASFKFHVKCYGGSLSDSEQLGIIDKFAGMSLEGPVVMKGSVDVIFACFIHAKTENDGMNSIKKDLTAYFGRCLGEGSRSLIDAFTLKRRSYLGTTSMDSELALIMANMAKVTQNSLVWDPFVGTGSCLYPAAKFGGFTGGSDIDGRQIRGSGPTLSLHSNASDYGVDLWGTLVADAARLHLLFRSALLFDAIIADPPYGVRAGAKRLGSKHPGARLIPPEWRSSTYPETIPYQLDDLIRDLLDLAASKLAPGGRLVFWYPIVFEEFGEEQALEHDPAAYVLQDGRFEVIADCPQRLRGLIRRLITLQRKE